MQTYITVLAFVVNAEGRYLLLQRSPERHEHPNVWNVVTGYINERESVEAAAVREVKEETNLDTEILIVGKPEFSDEEDKRWVGFPVLLRDLGSSGFEMDEDESQTSKWVTKEEFSQMGLKWLAEILQRLKAQP
ncbi:MAG: NUDIX domain-containing protein [Candidatus Doudnabacteria bacterium]|nr:NUDIX domain-containing protein [Candidatus Doudnabacteria bacterium]